MSYRFPQFNYHSSSRPAGDPRRSQQIDELLTVFPSARPTQNDRSIIEVPLTLTDARIVGLRLVLPSLFPEQPPRLALCAPFHHSHVDSNLNVDIPMLRSWSPVKRLVEAVFEAQQILSSSDINQHPMPEPSPVLPQPQNQSSQLQQPAQPVVSGPAPQEHISPLLSPRGVGDLIQHFLQSLSDEELEQLAIDPEIYKQVIYRFAKDVKIVQDPSPMLKANSEQARENLERDAEIQDRTRQIAIVKSSDYESMKELYAAKIKEYEEMQEGVALSQIVDQFQNRAQEFHEESETLKKSALDGEVDTTTFVDDYLKLRTEYHKKRIMAASGARLCH